MGPGVGKRNAAKHAGTFEVDGRTRPGHLRDPGSLGVDPVSWPMVATLEESQQLEGTLTVFASILEHLERSCLVCTSSQMSPAQLASGSRILEVSPELVHSSQGADGVQGQHPGASEGQSGQRGGIAATGRHSQCVFTAELDARIGLVGAGVKGEQWRCILL